MTDNRTFTRDPLRGSLCASCQHRASRVIIPFHEMDYGIDREAMGIPADEEVTFEHHMCKELAIDLDHLVIECDHYCKKGSSCLFIRKIT